MSKRGYQSMCLTKQKKEEIESRAEEYISEKNLFVGQMDIIEIVRSEGFKVIMPNTSSELDGFVFVYPGQNEILGVKTDKLIGVAKNMPVQKKRFIIAHELGHYILHYQDEEKEGRFAHRDIHQGKDVIEQEADLFAACILIPRKDFKEKYETMKKAFTEENVKIILANYYNVPKESIDRRIEEVYGDERDK